MDLTVIIEQDSEGWFIGTIPSLQSCRTQARTLTELYKRLQEVALLCLETEKLEVKTKLIGVQNLQIPSKAL